MIPVDNTSKFGFYKPNTLVNIIMLITRSIGNRWLSKRIIFLLRRIAIILSKDCIDTNLFNANLRMYTKGNVSEKRALFSPQIFEEEEREFIAERAQDNSIFIDIGANIGLYSFSIGNIYKRYKNTKIFSIEPHPDLFKRLSFNVSLNKIDILMFIHFFFLSFFAFTTFQSGEAINAVSSSSLILWADSIPSLLICFAPQRI